MVKIIALLNRKTLSDSTLSTKLLREINQLLILFSDYITLQESQAPLDPQISAYRGKHRALLTRVREIQILASAHRDDLEQEAREAKYLAKQEALPHESSSENPVSQKELDAETKSVLESKQVLSQNKRITNLLQTTRAMLHSSVLQSELNIDSLKLQTSDLRRLNDDYSQFNDLLLNSKRIVKFIEKQDRSDKRRIYFSALFFILCCSWVIWKRVLKIPVKLLLWSILRTLRIFNWAFESEVYKSISSVSTATGPATATAIVSSLILNVSNSVDPSIIPLRSTPEPEPIEGSSSEALSISERDTSLSVACKPLESAPTITLSTLDDAVPESNQVGEQEAQETQPVIPNSESVPIHNEL